jgi:surface protein
LKNINEKEVDFYINGIKYPHIKYFIPINDGIYDIIINIKNDIRDIKKYLFLFNDFLFEFDLQFFDFSKLINIEKMFSNLNNLVYIDLSSFDTRNLTSMENMFYQCENL